MCTITVECGMCATRTDVEGLDMADRSEELLAELSDAIEGGDRQRQRIALDALVAGDQDAREIVERARFRVRRVAA